MEQKTKEFVLANMIRDLATLQTVPLPRAVAEMRSPEMNTLRMMSVLSVVDFATTITLTQSTPAAHAALAVPKAVKDSLVLVRNNVGNNNNSTQIAKFSTQTAFIINRTALLESIVDEEDIIL